MAVVRLARRAVLEGAREELIFTLRAPDREGNFLAITPRGCTNERYHDGRRHHQRRCAAALAGSDGASRVVPAPCFSHGQAAHAGELPTPSHPAMMRADTLTVC